jgi:hypothetical protein
MKFCLKNFGLQRSHEWMDTWCQRSSLRSLNANRCSPDAPSIAINVFVSSNCNQEQGPMLYDRDFRRFSHIFGEKMAHQGSKSKQKI